MPAFAQELGAGLQAHGFISQSVAHTSDNRVGGKSDEALAWDLREMGANLSWRPSPDWLISGQALARWAGKSDEGECAWTTDSWTVPCLRTAMIR
jgi:hypothetical protein